MGGRGIAVGSKRDQRARKQNGISDTAWSFAYINVPSAFNYLYVKLLYESIAIQTSEMGMQYRKGRTACVRGFMP